LWACRCIGEDMTPEGKVKDAVKKILTAYKPLVYGHWPVQNGMGKPMLDYHGCCCGMYFAIETKKDFKQPLTPRQEITRDDIEGSLGKVFVIRGVTVSDTSELEDWLHRTVMQHKRKFNAC
jgi:hypothetical protein